MKSYLGFNAIISRKKFEEPPDLEFFFEDAGKTGLIPVKMFYHGALPGAVSEVAFLKRQSLLHVDGPWPDEPVDGDHEFVGRHIVNPSNFLKGGLRVLVDQIQHFSCHCDTQSSEGAFSLRAVNGVTQIDVPLDFLPLVRHWEYQDGFSGCDMPLVVFNNCGGAAMSEKQLNSFVEFFWTTNQNRGFISTHARIPDRLAEAFSTQFYVNLLRRRLPVGEAVAEARRAITLAHRNPVSLFYVHYGSPFLKLATSKA